ncbi:MAG: AfsR/SARP family transcriptional regulator, partial [Vicinamibacterales bacterium]
ESTAIFREIEDRWGVAFALQGLARVAASSGRASDAASLLGASDALREELGVDMSPPLRVYRDATIAIALPHLGEAAFWSAWTDGKNRDDPPALAPAEAPAVVVDLRIRALGAFETHVRNHRVEKTEWGSSRARELLAFIACHPEGCTKAQIGLALWPDASPGQLRNTFHVTMHRLRHALAVPDAIQVDGDRYRLNPTLTCEFDADLFEREVPAAIRDLRRRSTGSPRPEDVEGRGTDVTPALEAALARYRGDFLAGEPVGEWADEWRDRLRQLHVEGLDALGRALMERGRHADAADAFRTLLIADPVNEDACRRHMICLDRLGDRAGALRAYDALVRALRDELGVRPGRETAALRDKLVSTM